METQLVSPIKGQLVPFFFDVDITFETWTCFHGNKTVIQDTAQCFRGALRNKQRLLQLTPTVVSEEEQRTEPVCKQQ